MDLIHIHALAVAGGRILVAVVGHRPGETLVVLNGRVGKGDLPGDGCPSVHIHVQGGKLFTRGTDGKNRPAPHLGQSIEDRISRGFQRGGSDAHKVTDRGSVDGSLAGGLLNNILQDRAGLLDVHVIDVRHNLILLLLFVVRSGRPDKTGHNVIPSDPVLAGLLGAVSVDILDRSRQAVDGCENILIAGLRSRCRLRSCRSGLRLGSCRRLHGKDLRSGKASSYQCKNILLVHTITHLLSH